MPLPTDSRGNPIGTRSDQGPDSSASEFYAVTIGTPWDIPCRALFVGTGGTSITLVNSAGQAVVFANVPNGTILDVRTINVSAASGASGIVRLM